MTLENLKAEIEKEFDKVAPGTAFFISNTMWYDRPNSRYEIGIIPEDSKFPKIVEQVNSCIDSIFEIKGRFHASSAKDLLEIIKEAVYTVQEHNEST